MRRVLQTVAKLLQGLSLAVLRFPLTVTCLLSSTVLVCYMISLRRSPELLVQKLMFVFLLGSFLGVTAQFACERFPRLARRRLAVYGVSALLTLAYYLITREAPAIDYGVGSRTAVAIFSMFCAFIWLPSYADKYDFNSVALVHFKSALTSILYAGVLSAGLAALIGAIDVLLFDVSNDAYGYMMAIVWILFATIYYLSRLPRFNSAEAIDQAEATEASQYPRILEILITQISIPLVSAYTLVLLAYFVKIGVTRRWPIGQLGPMILGYSAAGLLVYILASRLTSRLATGYQRLFPRVLIPIVLMQLISVYIRLRAYGVTESRYYVALFGLFSLVLGVALSLRPVTRNGLIALLAAGFAIFSVLPPVDAFTVSRYSQVTRLERMLQSAGVLVDGKLQPQTGVELNVRLETTNILNYLNQRGHLTQVNWLPAGFDPHRDMQAALGYGPTYKYMGEEVQQHFFANLDTQQPLSISGYDVLLEASSHRKQEDLAQEFRVSGKAYQLVQKRVSTDEVRVFVRNAAGEELVATGLHGFASKLLGTVSGEKGLLPAEQLTLDVENSQCQLRIIFRSIQSTRGLGEGSGTDYGMIVLIAIP